MESFSGSFTPGTTGVKTIYTPMVPKWVFARGSGKSGVHENDQARLVFGTASSNSVNADSILTNTNYPKGLTRELRDDDDLLVKLYATPGGILTPVVQIKHIEFGYDEGAGLGYWSYEVVTSSLDYRIAVDFLGDPLPGEES